MPLVPGRRGAFGDWLKTEREKRYRTQADALADYRRLAGLVITPSEYAQWESGSRVPKETNPKRVALYSFYGSRETAPPAAVSAPADQSAVVAAIRENTTMLSAVLTELRTLVGDRAAVNEAQTTLLVGLTAQLTKLAGQVDEHVEQTQRDDPRRSRPASTGSK